MKKSVLVIGIGRLGSQLAEKMQDMGHDVMILDYNKEAIEKYTTRFSDARIADYTNEDVLRKIDAGEFDLCFITVGNDFEASVTTTFLLKNRLGAKMVLARARDEVQGDILRKVGADQVIFTDGMIAESLAAKYGERNIYECTPINDKLSLYEVPIMKDWVGHSVKELNVRQKYKINIVTVHHGDKLDTSPSPDYVFQQEDKIYVVGSSKEVFNYTSKI